MKKLLFVLAFTFIGEQAYSQIYLMTISDDVSIIEADSALVATELRAKWGVQ